MPINTFFGSNTLIDGAAAVSLDAFIRDSALTYPYVGSPIGCSLYFIADKDIRVGNSATSADDSHGLLLTAGTPFTDSATGVMGNAVDLNQFYIFAPTSGGNASVSIFFRGM